MSEDTKTVDEAIALLLGDGSPPPVGREWIIEFRKASTPALREYKRICNNSPNIRASPWLLALVDEVLSERGE